jgi:hypothetical protein
MLSLISSGTVKASFLSLTWAGMGWLKHWSRIYNSLLNVDPYLNFNWLCAVSSDLFRERDGNNLQMDAWLRLVDPNCAHINASICKLTPLRALTRLQKKAIRDWPLTSSLCRFLTGYWAVSTRVFCFCFCAFDSFDDRSADGHVIGLYWACESEQLSTITRPSADWRHHAHENASLMDLKECFRDQTTYCAIQV